MLLNYSLLRSSNFSQPVSVNILVPPGLARVEQHWALAQPLDCPAESPSSLHPQILESPWHSLCFTGVEN